MEDAGEQFDPKAYLSAITGYYSTSKGEMLSFPFNSSSMVMWINKDALKKADIGNFEDMAGSVRRRQKLKAAGYDLRIFHRLGDMGPSSNSFPPGITCRSPPRPTVSTASIPCSKFNAPLHVKHLQKLIDLQKDKTYDYCGRANAGEARFGSANARSS